MSDGGVRQLIQGMVGHNHLKEVYVPERCKEENIEATAAMSHVVRREQQLSQNYWPLLL